MTREMLDDAHGLIDAANVDLKAFNEDFYRKHVNGRVKGVMDSLTHMKRLDIWVEVTTLLIPTLNDDPSEIRNLARFIKEEVGPETPWHISRFYPQYKEGSLPPTNVQALHDARQIGFDEGLSYVYLGNVPGQGETTACPKCSHLLVDRVGYTIREYAIEHGTCPQCGHVVEGMGL